jgi:hypothetical protein
MGEHADDTMNCDDEPGDHIIGDGGPQDVAIMEFMTGLRATPRQVREGFAFQESVMHDLGPDWVDSRTMISDRRSLHRSRDRSYLSYLESIQGDLTDLARGTTMECQTGVSNPYHVSWEHSKRLRSQADWQCFGFTSGLRLVVRTEAIRAELDRWDVKPQESLRADGGPYYSFGEAFLRNVGAIEFDAWLKQYQA